MLDLSKIEAGKLELNPETGSIRPRLIDEVIGTVGQLAEENNNRLAAWTAPEQARPAPTTDPMRLRAGISCSTC